MCCGPSSAPTPTRWASRWSCPSGWRGNTPSCGATATTGATCSSTRATGCSSMSPPSPSTVRVRSSTRTSAKRSASGRGASALAKRRRWRSRARMRRRRASGPVSPPPRGPLSHSRSRTRRRRWHRRRFWVAPMVRRCGAQRPTAPRCGNWSGVWAPRIARCCPMSCRRWMRWRCGSPASRPRCTVSMATSRPTRCRSSISASASPSWTSRPRTATGDSRCSAGSARRCRICPIAGPRCSRNSRARGSSSRTFRFDLLRLRSAGVQSAIDDVATATQEARALSREIAHVLSAAEELKAV